MKHTRGEWAQKIADLFNEVEGDGFQVDLYEDCLRVGGAALYTPEEDEPWEYLG
jgi:hypothetical protein